MANFPHLRALTTCAPLAGMLAPADIAAGSSVVCAADPNLWATARLARAGKGRHVPAMGVGGSVLLAQGDEGWAALRALASDIGDLRGAAPDWGALAARGAVARLLLLGDPADAALPGSPWVAPRAAWAGQWVELRPDLGADAARRALSAALDLGLPVAATAGARYRARSDAPAAEVLRAIAEKRRVSRDLLAHLTTEAAALGAEPWRGAADPLVASWGHLCGPDELRWWLRAAVGGADADRAMGGAEALALACGTATVRLGITALPRYRGEDGREVPEADQARVLRERAHAGLRERCARLGLSADARLARLDEELAVIEATGFAGYFLIFSEFVGWARAHGIALGTGRGSAAGSLCVWALGITSDSSEPVRHGLLFERFLNPERVTSGGGLPDIDQDLCKRRRGEVVQHLRDVYGEDSVGQILTRKVLAGKTAIKDAGRALGMSFGALNAATAGAPQLVDGKTPTVAWLAANVPALRAPGLAEALAHAAAVEGCVRESGVHASGIVVSRGPLRDWVPTCRVRGGALACAWDMNDAEAAGLVKLDLLGLTTTTMIDMAARYAAEEDDRGRQREDEEVQGRRRLPAGLPEDGGGAGPAGGRGCGGLVHRAGDCPTGSDATAGGKSNSLAGGVSPGNRGLDALPLDDPAVYALYAAGDTAGVFQAGRPGFRRMLRGMRPDRFGDIVASLALYRPGPLKGGMTDSYVARKRGREPVAHLHPALAEVMAPTYGTLCYQEQCMQIARILAGYTLGGADVLRKAIGKKKPEVMAAERGKFMAGCERVGLASPAQAAQIWAFVEKFAEYGFNLAHSTTYALLSYQTAWLKVHQPGPFYAAWLSTLCDESDRFRKIAEAVYDARERGILVLPPDVNASAADFRPCPVPAGWAPDPLDDRSAAGPDLLAEIRALEALGAAAGAGGGQGPPAAPEPPQRPAQARPRACVRYGLAALRGLSRRGRAEVLAHRPFADMADLLRRARLTRADLAALAGSGALDGVLAASGADRLAALANLDELAKWGARERKASTRG